MKLSIITDLYGLEHVREILDSNFEVSYLSNCSEQEFINQCSDTEIIFTNPNNSQFPLSGQVLSKLTKLKIITTASTGTVHIDLEYCNAHNIKVISIKDEISTLREITSTAEHAVLLTLTLLRKTNMSIPSVWEGLWDYRKYTGRQVNKLAIGTVGLGRLGSIYAKIMSSFGAEVFYFDPYVSNHDYIKLDNLAELARTVDVLAINCHVTEETTGCINEDILSSGNFSYLINTARGEIVNENAVLKRLECDKQFYYGTDVISNEQNETLRMDKIRKFKKFVERVVITPHQGGMTFDARNIAYKCAVDLLLEFTKNQELN